MTQSKKLIEVAMPVKEISAECVRDDRIQHGHISSLHKWWARRPLPVCRAVVFASLVPDPMDENCPQSFRDAVEILLGKKNNPGDPYKTYEDIPWTAVYDPMEDDLRNRLQMFIGKFTPEMQQHLLHSKPKPAAGKMLTDYSLIKWDNKNNEIIIGKARKLIWVAHNSSSGKSAEILLSEFDQSYKAIKDAEAELYSLTDRHLESEDCKLKTANLEIAKEAFLDCMPKVFDPFAGGGAIPLEAARLGCRSFGNDINPVAHIIQKGSLEFPQKYGKPITYTKDEFIKLYGEELWQQQPLDKKVIVNQDAVAIRIDNRLSFDVQFYVNKAQKLLSERILHFYQTKNSKNSPLIYYWVKVGICSNPTCKAEIPLLKQFYLCNKDNKKIYLNPIIRDNKITFEISEGTCNLEPWIQNRKSMKCPICYNTTTNKELKDQFILKKVKDLMVAVIEESKNGKNYRLPFDDELYFDFNSLNTSYYPSEVLPLKYTKAFDLCTWGYVYYGDLFSKRQLYVLNELINIISEISKNIHKEERSNYYHGVMTYLAIWFNRMASRMTQFSIIDLGGEKVVDLFGKQAIQMVFDFPEINILKLEQLSWIIRYIESESHYFNASEVFNCSSGDKKQFNSKFFNAVITDPPYYDAIGYADLSDFYYSFLKRICYENYPMIFNMPQTPKTEECTALKHHHNNSTSEASLHFENKLLQIFSAIEHQTKDTVSIMYAHQSTEAWTTLCNSILGAKMNITGSWAIDTEKQGGLKKNKAFLSSSVTVSCRPSQRVGFADFKEVKKAIETTVAKEVDSLFRLGFRGADLLTACFGQAVSEFGKYEKVEKADGSEVTVAELLELARESAFNALLKGFDGDDFTKFYIGWLQLFGFVESDFDDAAKFSRVGLSINVQELFTAHILIKNGNKQTLGGYLERLAADKNLGDKLGSILIDQVHRAMYLYKSNRSALLSYLAKVGSTPESPFWRVLTSICEVLPKDGDKDSDYTQAFGLMTNKESLIRDSKSSDKPEVTQQKLFE